MSHCNHRVVFDEFGAEVAEVHYNDDGTPACYAVGKAYWSCDDGGNAIESLKEQCQRMLNACDKPALHWPDDFVGLKAHTEE